jgi:hypothetical protein
MNNQAAQTMPSLVDEALTYFAKAGDEGDRRYVEAIRQHIAALSQPAGVPDGWRKLAMAELTRWMCARDAETAYERLTTALAAAQAASGGECQTCGGRGEIGGHVGQTAETFDYVTEPCPDCAPQPPSGASLSERASSSMNLLRFGRGNGATPWILEPHIDGYWTPWHTAQSELDMAVESSTQLERALEQALTQQRALSSPRQEGEAVGEVGVEGNFIPYAICDRTGRPQEFPPGTKLYTHPSTADR